MPVSMESSNLRPLTIITGIVLGSAASITLGLAVVIIIFWFTGLDETAAAHRERSRELLGRAFELAARALEKLACLLF